MHESDEDLGKLSRAFEARNDPGAIGFDEVGGWSYGHYQLASRKGRVGEFLSFLAGSARPPYERFGETLTAAGGDAAARAGSAGFKKTWRQLATSPEFVRAQHDYIRHTHYDVFAARLRPTLDLEARSAVLRDVAWSVSVQHGPAATCIFERALAALDPNGRRDDSRVVDAVYTERKRVDVYFSKSNAAVRAAVLKRFEAERLAAHARLLA